MHPERVRQPPKRFTPKEVPTAMQTKRKRPSSGASSASKRGKKAASAKKASAKKASASAKKAVAAKSNASSVIAPGSVADDDQADSREDKRSKDTARQIARMRTLAKRIGIPIDPFVEEYRRQAGATIEISPDQAEAAARGNLWNQMADQPTPGDDDMDGGGDAAGSENRG